MSCRKAVLGLVVTGLVTVLTAGMAFAQAGGGAGTGGGGGGFGGGGRQNMMDRMMNNIKEQLGVTDDEWTVLQPKVQKVMDLSRDLRAGGLAAMFGGGRGGRGGRGGGAGGGGDTAAPTAPPAQPTSEIADKTTALRTTLDNKDADPKDIAQKLAALRDARERTKADLIKAQGELKELLTPRQEAQLVMMGLLD
jgi:Spy/CpxP family protein refolding chaperone